MSEGQSIIYSIEFQINPSAQHEGYILVWVPECAAQGMWVLNFIHHEERGCKLYKDQRGNYFTSGPVPYQFPGQCHVK